MGSLGSHGAMPIVLAYSPQQTLYAAIVIYTSSTLLSFFIFYVNTSVPRELIDSAPEVTPHE
jgi:hypothetical protein